MSWSDLERLVADAETSPALQQVLRQCHSRQELLRTARQLGYRITKGDLMPGWSPTTRRKCKEGIKPSITEPQGFCKDWCALASRRLKPVPRARSSHTARPGATACNEVVTWLS